MSRTAALQPERQQAGWAAPRLAEHGGVRASLLPRAPYDVRFTPHAPMIGFAFEAQAGVHAFASDRRTAFRTRPNGLAYVPAGCEVMSCSDEGGEYLLLAGRGCLSCELETGRRFNDHVDPAVLGSARALRRMLIGRGPVVALDFEAAVMTLRDAAASVQVNRFAGSRAAQWMTARRLRLIDDIIEDRLDGSLTVTEIGAALGLSTGFFARAFRLAVGTPPHDYIIERRLSRARVLLRTTDEGLADIAAACGFASHAHMTTIFRRRLGATPSALRNGC